MGKTSSLACTLFALVLFPLAVTSDPCIGFFVSTLPNPTPLAAVVDGVTLIGWQQNESVFDETVSPTVVSLSFGVYFTASGGHEVQPFTVTNIAASPTNIAAITASGNASSPIGGVLDGTNSYALSVALLCQSPGSTVITVQMTLPGYNPIAFAFQKRCGTVLTSLDIGTQKNTSDVVSNGVTSFMWDVNTFVAFVPGDVLLSPFFVSIAPNATTSTRISVVSISSASPEVCVAYLDGSSTAREGANLTSSSSAPLVLGVAYNCSQQGQSKIRVDLELGPYDPISFEWTKDSGGALPSVPSLGPFSLTGSYLGLRPNLQIGLSSGSSNVVENGVINLLWAPSVHSGYNADPGVPSTFFYLSLSTSPLSVDTQLVTSVALTSSEPSCSPHLGLTNTTAQPPFWITRSTPPILQVFYNCSQANTETVVTLTMGLAGFNSLEFAWTKQTGASRLAFQMGTTTTVPDMVSDGTVGLLYLPAIHLMSVPSFVDESSFFLWMSEAGSFQGISSMSIVSFNDSCKVEIDGYPVEVSQAFGNMAVSYYCNGTAVTATIELTIQLQGGYAPLVLAWTKICGGSRNFFTIGSVPSYGDVVSDGIALPMWQPGTAYSKVPSGTNFQTFYLFMQKQTQEFSAPKITASSDSIVSYAVSGSATDGGLLTDSFQTLIFVYTCKTVGTTVITVTIEVEPYETIVFAWRKACGVPPPGFSVGTSSNSTDVVDDGQMPGLHTAFTLAGIPTKTFYFWSQKPSVNFTLTSLTVHTSNASNCSPYMLGAGSLPPPPNAVVSATPMPLIIVFNCTALGSANIAVNVSVGGPYKWMEFVWLKRNNMGREGLVCGTTRSSSGPTSDNVVYNGVATPEFDPVYHSAFYLSFVPQAEFYFRMLPDFAPQRLSAATVAVDRPHVCAPYLKGLLATPGGVMVGAYNSTQPQLQIVFNCTHSGVVNINVTLQVENFPPLVFALSKLFGGSRRYFDIGTVAWSSDVVQDGVVMPLWYPDPGILNHATISGAVSNTTFYLSMSANQTQAFQAPQLEIIYSWSNETQGPTGIDLSLSGPASNGGISAFNEPQSFSVIYKCSTTGEAVLQLTLALPPYDPCVIQWTKHCGLHRGGFSIGTVPGGEDVVSDGHVTLAYSWEAHIAFVLGNVQQTSLYIAQKPYPDEPTTQTITAVSLASGSPICTPYFASPTLFPGVVVTSTGLVTTVVYNCSKLGQANIAITLSLDNRYMPLRFAWTKRVGGIRSGFNVGTKPTSMNVVQDGITSFAWDPRFHSANFSNDQPTLTFFASLSATNGTQPTSQVVSTPFAVVDGSRWLRVSLGGDLVDGGVLLAGHPPSTLAAEFECYRSGHHNVTIHMPLETFSSVRFAFAKYCPDNLGILSVGTVPGEDDVVSGGIATREWTLLNHSYVSSPSTGWNAFYLQLQSPSEQLLTQRVVSIKSTSTNASVCVVDLEGPLMDSMTISSDVASLLVAKYTCFSQGGTDVSVSIEFGGNFSATLFSWTKEIYGSRPGFSISTHNSITVAPNVVADGEAVYPWDGNFTAATTVHLAPFYIFLSDSSSSSTLGPQNFTTPTLSIEPFFGCNSVLLGTGVVGGMAVNYTAESLMILYRCYSVGIMKFSLTLQVPPFDPVVLQWAKQSNGHLLGFDVTSVDSAMVQNVVTDGHVSPDWASNYTQVPSTTKLVQFAIQSGLPAGFPPVSFNTPAATTLDPNCAIAIGGNASTGGSVRHGEALVLDLLFDSCKSENSVNVTVTINLSPFQSVVFQFEWFYVPPPADTQIPVTTYVLIAVGAVVFLASIAIGYLLFRRFQRNKLESKQVALLQEERSPLLINSESSSLD